MSKRKNYGSFILIASLVLGVFLLTGSFIWMADKANMMLAVFVLILYGVGQWMTVVYWQNIQNDWEATGEVLGRLQQAVSEIPAALDSNLKAIAEKLSQSQQEALSKLQSEVSAGAKETLEKGALLIGESISKNFQAPVTSLTNLLSAFTEKANEQQHLLKILVSEARTDAKQSVESGSLLVAQSLDKNLRDPLAAMESTLHAWRKDADTQSNASQELGQLLQKSQMDWMQKAQSMVEELKKEFQTLVVASHQHRVQAESGWVSHAKEIQLDWENRIRTMQDSLLATVSHEGEKMGAAMIQGGHVLVTQLEGLQILQLKSQNEILDRALSGLESQGQMGLEVAEKVSELSTQMGRSNEDFQKLAQLSNINQAELQANVSMLNTGLESILDRLEKQADAGDAGQNFLGELARALGAFQERASDVLIENAMKTQEILMEVLRQSELRNQAESLTTRSIDSEALA